MKRVAWIFGMLAVVAMADDARPSEGVKAYEATLFRLIRANCVRCHDGRRQYNVSGPSFAVENLQTSYDRIKRYVKFDDIPGSLLVRKGGNLHCLNDYGFDCRTTHDDLRRAIQEWWDKGEKEIAPARPVTAEMDPPAAPTNASLGFLPMRFDVSALTGVRQAIFEVEIQRFQGAYRFRKPRLASSEKPLEIRDVRIRVNGKEDSSASTFSSISRTVAPVASPIDESKPLAAPVLSGETLIVLRDREGTDKISVSFGRIAQAETPKCKDLESFKRNVLRPIQTRQCFSCHGRNEDATGQLARTRFRIHGVSDEQLCSSVLERSDVQSPRRSPYFLYAIMQANGHPKIFTSIDEIEPGFSEWLRTESQVGPPTASRAPAPPEDRD